MVPQSTGGVKGAGEAGHQLREQADLVLSTSCGVGHQRWRAGGLTPGLEALCRAP
jgi:hypothetical protein